MPKVTYSYFGINAFTKQPLTKREKLTNQSDRTKIDEICDRLVKIDVEFAHVRDKMLFSSTPLTQKLRARLTELNDERNILHDRLKLRMRWNEYDKTIKEVGKRVHNIISEEKIE